MTAKEYPQKINYFSQQLDHRISLKEEFKLERKAMRALTEEHEEQVYLSTKKQRDYLVKINHKKLFYTMDLRCLDGEINFVLTCEDPPSLLCGDVHHSYLANGKKVLASGSLIFKNGQLIGISNNSGHYRPTNDEMLPVIKALYKASGCTLQFYVSYSRPEVEVYSVKSLIEVAEFSDAIPRTPADSLPNSELPSPDKPVNGYEQKIVVRENAKPKKRFGKVLSNDLQDKYKKITQSDNDSEINTALNTFSFFKEEVHDEKLAANSSALHAV